MSWCNYNMTALQETLEHFAPRFAEIAYRFTNNARDVEKLWVYVTEEEGVSVAEAFYLIGGRYLHPFEIQALIADVDSSPEAQDNLFDGLLDVLNELFEEVPDGSLPTRTIISYVPSTNHVEVDHTDAPLQPGVPDDELVPDATLARRWFERLRSTGEESATL